MADRKTTTAGEPDRQAERRELRRSQFFGLVAGLIGGWMSGNFWPMLPAALGWGGVLVWGAAIGATLGSLGQFEKAGRVLTRSDNRLMNLAVGLSVPLLIIALLAFILQAVR